MDQLRPLPNANVPSPVSSLPSRGWSKIKNPRSTTKSRPIDDSIESSSPEHLGMLLSHRPLARQVRLPSPCFWKPWLQWTRILSPTRKNCCSGWTLVWSSRSTLQETIHKQGTEKKHPACEQALHWLGSVDARGLGLKSQSSRILRTQRPRESWETPGMWVSVHSSGISRKWKRCWAALTVWLVRVQIVHLPYPARRKLRGLEKRISSRCSGTKHPCGVVRDRVYTHKKVASEVPSTNGPSLC